MFNLEFTENNQIKVIYLEDIPIKVKASALLSTLRIPIEACILEFKNKGHWYILGLNYNGCSHLRLAWDDKKLDYILPFISYKNKPNKPHKVICLGLNKTGTTSFKSGLEELGYNLMPEALGHQFIQADIENNDYSSLNSILNNPRFNAYEDLPFSLKGIYKKLYEINSKAKFILTVRNPKDWVYSVLNFYSPHFENLGKDFMNKHYYDHHYGIDTKHCTPNWVQVMFRSWGITSTENLEKQLENVYNSHVREITEFFKQKGGDLYLLDVSQKGAFKALASWLGEKTDKEDFPWLNKAE